MLLHKILPEFLCCTESHITEQVNDGELSLTNYHLVRSNSISTHTAGVALYIKSDVKFKVVENYVFEFNNVLVIDIFDTRVRGRWFLVYHSPNYSHAQFLNRFDEILETHSDTTMHMKAAGDFNINMNDPHFIYGKRLLGIASRHDMTQIVTDFTRIEGNSRTIIDLVFTSDASTCVKVDDDGQIADHKTLFICVAETSRESNTRKVIDRSRLKEQPFLDKVREKIDYDLIDHVSYDEKVNTIMNSIKQSVQELTNYKLINIDYSKEWFSDELQQLRLERDATHVRAVSENSELAWAEYRSVRNLYNKRINSARNDQIRMKISENRHDSKKLWKCLKQHLGKHEQITKCIEIDGHTYHEPTVIANKLNEFFVDSVKEIVETIPEERFVLPDVQINRASWRTFRMTNDDEIRDVLKNMKSKTGVEGVNVTVIEHFLKDHIELLLDIFNHSLTEGIVPKSFNYTIVTPIPKVKNSNKGENLRPVNSAQVVDKALQTIVKRQFNEYIQANNILSESQSAFRRDHSCESSLNLVLNQWKLERDSKKVILAVFLDLKRAFEAVDRSILIKKMRNYGIDGTVLKWFESWLADRKQCVKYQEVLSEMKDIELGIPQGTPLSCMTFNVFFNDVVHYVHDCHINLFADDVLIWVASDSIEEAFTKMNGDLESIANYLLMVRLKLNVQKTKAMLVASRAPDDLHLYMDGQEIAIVDKIKYLGVTIDNKLKFRENTANVIAKMSQKIGFMRRNRRRFDRDTRLLLYKSIVSPHLDYCASVLFLANEGEMAELQRTQNRALRIILNCDRYASVAGMLKSLELMSVRQRIYFDVLMLIYKVQHNLLPSYLSRFFNKVDTVQPYALRNCHKLRPPSCTTTMAHNSVIYKGVLLYNTMSDDIQIDHDNVNNFKQALSIYVKEKF